MCSPKNLPLDDPTAGSGAQKQPGPYGRATPSWDVRSTLPHRAGESGAASNLSPQAESGCVISLVSLLRLQCGANTFLHGRTLPSTEEPIRMALSSLVRSEISAS